jgi:predicted nucleic-acid-binding Zn-ribbon protein
MQTPRVAPCPNCGGANLYRARKSVSAGGGYAPNYLPGLGTLFLAGKFRVVVCRDCGLTRFFAEREARDRLPDAGKWERA